jgi:hypothetical protein
MVLQLQPALNFFKKVQKNAERMHDLPQTPGDPERNNGGSKETARYFLQKMGLT